MDENPFKGKKRPHLEKDDVSGDAGDLGLEGVCPFLTAPTLSFIASSVQDKMKGAPAMMPVLPLGLSPCIGESCTFWRVEQQDCRLVRAADALIRLGERRPTPPNGEKS